METQEDPKNHDSLIRQSEVNIAQNLNFVNNVTTVFSQSF